MPVQPDDFKALAAVAKYYVLTREQIQSICWPDQTSGRATRKRLLRLLNSGFLSRHSVPVALPEIGGAAPVYYATRSGAEALCDYFDDESYLATNTRLPRGDRLAHWIAINCTRLTIEKAISRQQEVALEGWFTEWETINKDAAESQQFVLHTHLSDNPPLSCSPDAAMLLCVRGHKKVFYLEQDRGTSSPAQVAARKSKGYSELAERSGHLKHFPASNVATFSVLFVTTSDYRCRALGRSISKTKHASHWLMVNQTKLTADSFLSGNVVFDHEGSIGPLIKPAS